MRLVLVVVAALVWRSMEAVALAFLLSSMVAAPSFLLVANRATPGIFVELARSLGRSMLVTLAVLLPPALCVAMHGFTRTEPLPMVWLGFSTVAGIVFGLLYTERAGHPLAREPLYLTLKGRLLRVRPAR
jgi:hypothetical protein